MTATPKHTVPAPTLADLAYEHASLWKQRALVAERKLNVALRQLEALELSYHPDAAVAREYNAWLIRKTIDKLRADEP